MSDCVINSFHSEPATDASKNRPGPAPTPRVRRVLHTISWTRQSRDKMGLLACLAHPEEVVALLKFKLGGCETVMPKCDFVSIPGAGQYFFMDHAMAMIVSVHVYLFKRNSEQGVA